MFRFHRVLAATALLLSACPAAGPTPTPSTSQTAAGAGASGTAAQATSATGSKPQMGGAPASATTPPTTSQPLAGSGGASAPPIISAAGGTTAPPVVAMNGAMNGTPSEGHATCSAMVAAAKEFIASVDSASLKSAVQLPFDKRHNYAYEPQVADRPGISLMMMSQAQQTKALSLVHSGLSERGVKQAETVRQLENLKGVTMFQVNMRDPSYYWLAIFGEPSETGEWAWQWEGHHLALHFTMRACQVADTPTFIGAWPAKAASMVAGGPAVGSRNLDKEEDLGRALAMSLNADPQKRMQAFITSAYRQMFPEGPDKQTPLTPAGIAASAMSDGERKQLRELIELYAGVLAPDLKAARIKRIEDHGGFDKVTFVWSGALEANLPTGQAARHYYRIQGASFMIEYRNDDGNHIHTAFRDFSGEFGDDLAAAK